jgi:hypothetical protein
MTESVPFWMECSGANLHSALFVLQQVLKCRFSKDGRFRIEKTLWLRARIVPEG